MNRRSFLVRMGGAILTAPAVLHLTACGSDDGGGNADAARAISFSVTSDGGHVHDLVLRCSDVSGSADITYTSSSTNSHTHQVMLTAAELGTIASGATVTKTVNDGHMHTWSITKPSSAC